MTINLPDDLSLSLRREVSSGRFESEAQAVAEIVREYLQRSHADHPADPMEPPDPIMGMWSDCADEVDEIVEEIYRQRRLETWRKIDL